LRNDRDRLRDILRAIDRIFEGTVAGRVAFEADVKLQVWVLYHLQIIGEAARGLSEDLRRRHPDPVWSKAIGLRNILVHHYFEIDERLVWQVIERDLPSFRELVVETLARTSGEDDS
jgi:uncharacterized protein with HEPN domain